MGALTTLKFGGSAFAGIKTMGGKIADFDGQIYLNDCD
jgi:hypothetical protein